MLQRRSFVFWVRCRISGNMSRAVNEFKRWDFGEGHAKRFSFPYRWSYFTHRE